MKRTFHFNNVDKWLKDRQEKVKNSRSLDWEDSWATDKKWTKEELDGFFSCKFCAKPMHKHSYEQGVITVSCRTPLCPGNANHEMKEKVDWNKYDIRKMTNQYLFNNRMEF